MNKYEIFGQWCVNNGTKLSEISLETYKNNERGVHSINGIRKGKTLIEIPEKLLITDKMGEESEYGAIFKKHLKHFRNHKIIYVMLYILQTKKEDFFFTPYYNILPRDLDNFPIFWDKEDIILLSGSNAVNEIITRQKSIIKDYEKLGEIIPGFKDKHTIDEFIWVRTVVGSRNFGITIDNVHRVALVPLSDFLNHDKDPDVTWGFNPKSRSFKMVSNRYLKKGKPITDTYGNKSNLKYLLFYGFTLQDNLENDVIYVNIVHGKNNLEEKNYIKKNIEGYLTTDVNSSVFHDILLFLRVSISNLNVLQNNKKISYYQQPISIDNEKLTIKAFTIYLNTKLKNYKYFNENSKNEYEKFSKKWNSYNLIMGEIKIIKFYLNYLNDVNQILNGNNKLLDKNDSIYYKMLKNII